LRTAATGALSVQKTNKTCNALLAVACSHMHAPYPQPHPHIPGASGKAESRYPQGFADRFETFLLDPNRPAV
jgi:hypothetical protein